MAASDEIERLACLCFVVIVPPRTVPPAAVCYLLGGHPEQEEFSEPASEAISMVAPSRVPAVRIDDLAGCCFEPIRIRRLWIEARLRRRARRRINRTCSASNI